MCLRQLIYIKKNQKHTNAESRKESKFRKFEKHNQELFHNLGKYKIHIHHLIH